jgi:PAS domain S-box-containing protein
VLGLTPDELSGTPVCQRIHPDDRSNVMMAVQTAKLTGEGQILEYRMQHRDGSWRVFESHANPVANEHGEVTHLVIVARDITERTKADEERRRMEVHLRHAQKMESIGQFAAGIAHEINTPT